MNLDYIKTLLGPFLRDVVRDKFPRLDFSTALYVEDDDIVFKVKIKKEKDEFYKNITYGE